MIGVHTVNLGNLCIYFDVLSSYLWKNHQIYPCFVKTISNREALLSLYCLQGPCIGSKSDCIPHVGLRIFLWILML
jgi:hypothetical protein